MAHTMTEDEWHAFVSSGTRTGKLATTRKDGRPHVTPVWFVLESGDLVFTTSKNTVKGHALRRTGQASMCIDDEQPPYSFVVITATAELDEDEDRLLRYATRIAARYMGSERAEEYGRRNAVIDELVVRLTPTHVIAMADIAD